MSFAAVVPSSRIISYTLLTKAGSYCLADERGNYHFSFAESSCVVVVCEGKMKEL